MRQSFLYLLSSLLMILSLSSAASAKEILLIGDSLTCGPFGARLAQNLVRERRVNLTVYCAIASRPSHWIRGENPSGHDCNTCSGARCKIWFDAFNPHAALLSRCQGGTGQMIEAGEILRQSRFDEVIVALGTNSLPAPKVDRAYVLMARMINEHGVSTCRWIGPPHFDQSKTQDALEKDLSLDSFYESLKSSINPRGSNKDCVLIDSRPATRSPKPLETTPDGVHRKARSARRWADAITQSL